LAYLLAVMIDDGIYAGDDADASAAAYDLLKR
jgi:hypothetical protein